MENVGERGFAMWRFSLVLAVFVLSGCVPDECEKDADCDDGIFCNGQERCSGLFGPCGVSPSVNSEFACACQPPRDPCRNSTPVCNELDDTCHACTTNADCDDGIVCTNDSCDASTGECLNAHDDANCGEREVCHVHSGQCVPGDCASAEVCAEPTPLCLLSNGRYVCARDAPLTFPRTTGTASD